MIISIGYRVNSITATKFRQWATTILKNYIQNGYVINGDKITNQRFKELENEVINLKSKVENISNSLENNSWAFWGILLFSAVAAFSGIYFFRKKKYF